MPPRSLRQRYAYIKTSLAIASVIAIQLGMTQGVFATSFPPPVAMEEVAGEWIGQCQIGDVFRLSLTEDGTGNLGYVRAWDEDDKVVVYDVKKVKLENGAIRITLSHETWGKIVLEGTAFGKTMGLRVKGLYRRTEPELHLVRPEAWMLVLDRLRSRMSPE
jgi:hypothetical protein